MKKSRFSEHQIINILKQADAGMKVQDLCRLNTQAQGQSHLLKQGLSARDHTAGGRELLSKDH